VECGAVLAGELTGPPQCSKKTFTGSERNEDGSADEHFCNNFGGTCAEFDESGLVSAKFCGKCKFHSARTVHQDGESFDW
jgi:hypothetical protein